MGNELAEEIDGRHPNQRCFVGGGQGELAQILRGARPCARHNVIEQA